MSAIRNYRLVAVGETMLNAVTVGIELDADRRIKAAVWWESKGDVDADEAEFSSVAEALNAAEAARALHSFDEVVVVLARPELWNADWGVLKSALDAEPMGTVEAAGLTSDEAYGLASAIEAERDA